MSIETINDCGCKGGEHFLDCILNGNRNRWCCGSKENQKHRINCPEQSGKINKTKLRNILRDKLNKVNLDDDSSLGTLHRLAEQLGIKKDEIPYHPQTPPDYHDEPGRPHFGPMQVRHASDLEIGKKYKLKNISWSNAEQKWHEATIIFNGFIYLEDEDINCNPKYGNWHMKVKVVEPKPFSAEKIITPEWSLYIWNLHPNQSGVWNNADAKNKRGAPHIAFLPEDADPCIQQLDQLTKGKKLAQSMEHPETKTFPQAAP